MRRERETENQNQNQNQHEDEDDDTEQVTRVMTLLYGGMHDARCTMHDEPHQQSQAAHTPAPEPNLLTFEKDAIAEYSAMDPIPDPHGSSDCPGR